MAEFDLVLTADKLEEFAERKTRPAGKLMVSGASLYCQTMLST
jgi:hypothetical protein